MILYSPPILKIYDLMICLSSFLYTLHLDEFHEICSRISEHRNAKSEEFGCSRNNLDSNKIEANRVRNGNQTESRKNSGKSSRNPNRDWGGGQEAWPGQRCSWEIAQMQYK